MPGFARKPDIHKQPNTASKVQEEEHSAREYKPRRELAHIVACIQYMNTRTP